MGLLISVGEVDFWFLVSSFWFLVFWKCELVRVAKFIRLEYFICERVRGSKKSLFHWH